MGGRGDVNGLDARAPLSLRVTSACSSEYRHAIAPRARHIGAALRLSLPRPRFAALLAAPSSFAKDPAAAKVTSDEAIQKAVLRVEVSIARRDWSAPWKLLAPESASGSAFAIAGDRLRRTRTWSATRNRSR